ncbi:MAG: LLM class flavin-dependent oxidoreductase [Halioglobus sp.]
MNIGMTLPVTEPGWNRDVLLQWAEKIDTGPFSSLALGERVFFPSPEIMATLGACAAITQRVKLVATVLILPMHHPLMTAKQLATIDMISGGRLVVGVGTGGRAEDYLASWAGAGDRRLSVLASSVKTMREVWAGGHEVEGALRPIEPLPVQRRGPKVLAGVMGPKGLASAAHWADGIAGMSIMGTVEDIAGSMQAARSAWEKAGGSNLPVFYSSFWFALGETADKQIHTHLNRYLNWLDQDSRNAMIEVAGFRGSPVALKERLKAIADTGVDELLLIPTSIDPEEVDRVAEIVASM